VAWTGDRGFTLVELMVAVLIIGILVAIAVPMFNSSVETARLRACLGNQRTIESAVRAYQASSGRLPGAGRLNGNGTPNTADVVVPLYLKSAPRCPSTNQWYYVNAAGTVTGDQGFAGFTAGHHHY